LALSPDLAALHLRRASKKNCQLPKERMKTEEKLDGRIKKAMNERNLNEGQWEDRKQWSLGVGQRIKTF